ncbi:unnamed protein product [Heterobilharzia americana]|nr:unnamed protein product [Heterobilharzia americana]
MQPRQLFDSAFRCLLPTNVIDASNLRQIPDNQEVFLHPSTSQSIIIEIMDHVEASDHEDAARVHFDAIGESNEATDSNIFSVRTVSLLNPDNYCSSVVLLLGQQKVAKFDHSTEDVVSIHMALYRYTEFQADVLVLVNDPVEDDDINTSPEGNHNQAHSRSQGNGFSTDLAWSQDKIDSLLLSLRLSDPSIFVF